MRAAGHDVLSFDVGEPDFDTPQHIKDACIAALQNGDTKYTAAPGTPKLRKAIAEKLMRENGLEYTARTDRRLVRRQTFALQYLPIGASTPATK